MFQKFIIVIIATTASTILFAQKTKKTGIHNGPDSIAPVGIIKGLSDSALLDVIQRQTFVSSGMVRIP